MLRPVTPVGSGEGVDVGVIGVVVVVIDAPQAGDHYLALHGTQAYSAVQVRATLE